MTWQAKPTSPPRSTAARLPVLQEMYVPRLSDSLVLSPCASLTPVTKTPDILRTLLRCAQGDQKAQPLVCIHWLTAGNALPADSLAGFQAAAWKPHLSHQTY